MNRERLVWPIVCLILISTLTACGTNPNRTPPGISHHLPGKTAGAIAAGKGGACAQIARTSIETAVHGTASAPTPDNLTPGQDRCTWTITRSAIGTGTLIVFQPLTPATTPPTAVPHQRSHGAIGGELASFDASTLTLNGTGQGHRFSTQFVPDPHSRPQPRVVEEALRSLWTSASPLPTTPPT